MSNTTPFIVSVISGSSFTTKATERIYKTKVVWANNAPNDHVKALSTHDVRALKKIYGHDPLEEITANHGPISGGGGSFKIDRHAVNLGEGDTTGGENAISESLFENNAPILSETRQKPIISAGNSEPIIDTAGDEFSLEFLGEALDASSQNAREKETRRMFQARYAPTKQLTFSREITVIKDIWVLQEDNLQILKRKIQLATGIPTYRQHLWYEQESNPPGESTMVTSPCYLLWENEKRIDINIWNLMSTTSIVQGMPVNTEKYVNRARIRVRNNEFSTTLESLSLDCESKPISWFVVDINDFITAREQLSSAIRNDVHVRELIYYGFIMQYWPSIPSGVFQTFISNEPLLHDEYPELAISDSLLQRQLGTEASIIAANPQPKIKGLPINVYIAESDIGIINEYYAYGGVVNQRALFNSFRLTPEMPYIIGRFTIGGRVHTLTKILQNGKVPSKKRHPNVDTICILYILPGLAEMLVYIHVSGTYHTETIWREDARINIDDAKTHTITGTGNVISKVNSLGENIVARPLVMMTMSNISIINTSIIISITRRLGITEFEGLKENAQLFRRAGMLNITSSESNTFMFHFSKGMHSYDDARFDVISNTLNGYEYATSIIVQQRWEGIYARQKLTSITSRSTDIYIRASGLKFSEYSPFIKFMLMLIEMPIINKVKSTVSEPRGIKAISQLKELDPLLYDLKKIYGNKTMYSQICQKPNQPIIVDKPTAKSVKYWNFTKKEPVYYECPSAKYHALYFKTGVHPANFCIPCCKKVDVLSGSKHDGIFSTCMKEHIYQPSKVETQVRSGYIISYTPEIEPGRISYLPEASLDQLFYQQFSTTGHVVDTECIPDLGYYVFGINQNVLGKTHVGVIISIAHALGIPIHDFISETAKKILTQSDMWLLLLNGRILEHFANIKAFIGELEMQFNSTSSLPSSNESGFTEWNEVFIDIARLYWNINLIIFIDSGDGNVFIKVPRGIKRADELISAQHKHLFIISASDNIYHPIYQIDTKVFKKTGAISQTLFNEKDKIIEIVKKMMTAVIAGPENQSADLSIDLDEALKWIDSQTQTYKLVHGYINRSNSCYAIQIKEIKSGKDIYFPVSMSLHDHLDIVRNNDEFSCKKYDVTIEDTLKLLNNFNDWYAANVQKQHSESSLQKKIEPAVWLFCEDTIIGFQDNSRQYNYYIKPISIDAARKLFQLPIVKLRYNPTEINSIINTRPEAKIDPALGRSLYEHHGYQLFVLEFISSIDRQRNTELREKINSTIRKAIKTPSIMFHELHDALSAWPRDYDHLIAIFLRFMKSRECTISEYTMLLSQKQSSWDHKTLETIIDQSRFEFDDIVMTSMFSMPPEEILSKLSTLLKDTVTISQDPINISKFPENIATCHTEGDNSSSPPEYCKNRKLRVSSSDYQTWSKQLALDIKNPLKQRKLMALMMRASMNEFSFNQFQGETIYIAQG